MKEIFLNYYSFTQYLAIFFLILCGWHFWKVLRTIWVEYSRLIKAGKLFPGPRSMPLLGNMMEFFITKKDALTVMIEIGKKYPTNRLWLASHLVINISRPKDIEVVIKSSKTAKKAFVYKFLGPEITNSLISGYGPKHRAHRKLLIPIISGEYLDDYMQVMNIQLRRSVDIMAEKVGLKEFDIHDETEYCLADIANEIIYGIPGVSEEQGVKLISFDPIISLDIFFHRIISPWLHPSFLFNLSNSGRKWSTIMKKTRNMMIKIVNEKRKLYEALARNEPDIKKPKPSMLDLLMEHVVKTNVMNDKEIISEANTLFLGFFDTVLGVYAFVMLMLAMYPKEQEKVREEIITVFGIDRDVMREDLKKLKYLDMVIKEVLRLFPAGPFLPREVTDDLELDEYTLPKGAMIIMMPILTHRSEEYWDKPDCFIPERFLPENSKDRHPFAFIPFSCGPRSCPGSKFGLACLKVMIVHFIRKYQLSTTMEFDKIKLKTHISIGSVDGYKVSIEKISP